MADVIVRPQDLEDFARELEHFNSELYDMIARLESRFARLGETWRDQEHAWFAEQFDETVRMLHRFLPVSEEQVPILYRKARAAWEFINQR